MLELIQENNVIIGIIIGIITLFITMRQIIIQIKSIGWTKKILYPKSQISLFI